MRGGLKLNIAIALTFFLNFDMIENLEIQCKRRVQDEKDSCF